MLRFNLEKLKRICNFDANRFYNVLCQSQGLTDYGSNATHKEPIAIPHGDSYIINLKDLLFDGQSTRQEKIQYIELASKRNLFDYRVNKDKTLNALLVNSKTIDTNTLLTVMDNKIHFKFEENTQWH